MTQLFITTILLAFGVLNIFAATAGDLDASFGTGGKVITAFRQIQDSGKKAIITPDGKILQFGAAWDGNNQDAGILKLNGDGSFDSTFGTNGKIIVHIPGSNYSLMWTGTVAPDGKIFAVGAYGDGVQGHSRGIIMKLTAGGALDTTFGTNGYALVGYVSPTGQDLFTLMNVAVLPDGKLLVSGTLDNFIGAARLNADGSIDTSYGTGGYTIIRIAAAGQQSDMQVTPDGAAFISGRFDTLIGNSNYSDYALVKLTSAGKYDTSFGTNGVVRIDLTPDTEADAELIESVKLQADGSILAAGRSGASYLDAVVFKFLPNGAYDQSFGTGGYKFVDYQNQNNFAYDMAVQTDGRIVLAEPLNGGDFLVQRLTANGDLDVSFGTGGSGGSVVTDLGGRDYPYSVNVAGNRIIVSGQAGGQNGKPRTFALAVYLQDAAEDVVIGGRVTDGRRGVSGAAVSLTCSDGDVRTARTNPFGYFRFNDVPSGQSCVIAVRSKRYKFQAQVVSATADLNDLSFIALL